MKCWVCNKDNATYTRDLTYVETDRLWGLEIPHREVVKNEHQRCYCENCYKETMAKLREENKLYIKLKRKRMFETALDKMERQKIDFAEYKEAIKAVEEYNLENDGKFDSSYEIMAAIVLIHNRVKIKPQFKVGKYQTDFLLSNHKIILEIDGDRHKHRKNYDSERDREIKKYSRSRLANNKNPNRKT